jgi:hypothetical protein
MNFTRDFLNEVLICRESIKVLLNEGTVVTINAGDEFTRINDIVAVSENYGKEIEELAERVQIKRKYGQYGSMSANSSAPVRDRIVEFVGKKYCNEEELQNFLLKLEEDRGTSFNQKQWFDRNQKYFQSFKNEGQQVWTLSKFGKRVLEHILKNKTKPMVNESKIGLFKFTTINESKSEPIFEGSVNLSNQFALVLVGGSIGATKTFPIFVGRDMGSIVETGDDKDALVSVKNQRNKTLSPGEKSYYGMSYKVIELTKSKVKQINNLIAFQDKSDDAEVSESELFESHEEQIKKECISRLSEFFGCSPGNLSKFKFDGSDNIKELTKSLRSSSDVGTEAYYKVAIEMAKKDLGL